MSHHNVHTQQFQFVFYLKAKNGSNGRKTSGTTRESHDPTQPISVAHSQTVQPERQESEVFVRCMVIFSATVQFPILLLSGIQCLLVVGRVPAVYEGDQLVEVKGHGREHRVDRYLR